MISIQPTDAFQQISKKTGKRWPAILSAKKEAKAIKSTLHGLLQKENLISSDTEMVVFGSLARNEWTKGSDVDWTLLVDGQADPAHLKIAQTIGKILEEKGYKKPGQTGVFGSLAFSHDIIHKIGGEFDTNRNMTRRILLLLESDSIGANGVRDRVIRAILSRYLEDDPSFWATPPKRKKIPRFLLNDVVRFWRTMAVDYACKRRERSGAGWAIRNIKLRLSRKLIFVSGVLMCFSCLIRAPGGIKQEKCEDYESFGPLINHLRDLVRMSPLGIVCQVLTDYATPKTARELLDAYNEFLDSINKPKVRKHLEYLSSDKATTDSVFIEMKEVSHKFQRALTDLFYKDKQLNKLLWTYGVF